MKHCVFSAAIDHPSCQEAIRRAKGVVAFLDNEWALEHDCILESYHSTFTEKQEYGNYSVWLSNGKDYQLISDCMAWARAYERFGWLEKQGKS